MELQLIRTYYAEGTNGMLFLKGERLCYTIELPWKDNQMGISCIPEGRYQMVKRYSEKFGWHLQLKNVPERELILIHPANDALQELRGCIAPVTEITGHGKGVRSRVVFEQLKALVFEAIQKKETIFITIRAAAAINENSSEAAT